MANRQPSKAARPGKAPPPRGVTAEEFRATSEFRHFKAVMRRLIAVPKAELDAMVRTAREKSPRVGDPSAPGRKPKPRKHVRRGGS